MELNWVQKRSEWARVYLVYLSIESKWRCRFL